MVDQHPVVNGRTFEPPGKGPWELETTHIVRPMTAMAQAAMESGFVRGFSESTARYGVLLSHLKPGFTQSFAYMQPVPVGAPEGAMGPPPKPVLQLVSRLHPEMRRRHRTAAKAMAGKQWRTDLKTWDEVDKPGAIAKHRSIGAIDVAALDDAALADHIDACGVHYGDMIALHHKYTITAILPVGDFLAGATAWTGASVAELMSLLRGRSEISRGFAAEELVLAADALAGSPSAKVVLESSKPADDILSELAAHPEVGKQVSEYLDAVRWRCVGYDLGDKSAGELPEALAETLRAALKGAPAEPTDDDSALQALRAKVPAEHQADFDERLAEVRQIYRIRDERGVFGDGSAVGLARRALLEAGRRLQDRGQLSEAEHGVELSAAEARALLLGTDGPDAAEVADRFAWRTSVTTSDAPPFLNAMPPPPPPPDWFPAPARRTAAAIGMALGQLFVPADKPNTATVVNGLSVNAGVYEGTARLVAETDGFDRIKQGDVLVTQDRKSVV